MQKYLFLSGVLIAAILLGSAVRSTVSVSFAQGAVETLCNDGADNDRDGLIDCADVDCVDTSSCGGSSQTAVCGDGECGGGETCDSCSSDCGVCLQETSFFDLLPGAKDEFPTREEVSEHVTVLHDSMIDDTSLRTRLEKEDKHYFEKLAKYMDPNAATVSSFPTIGIPIATAESEKKPATMLSFWESRELSKLVAIAGKAMRAESGDYRSVLSDEVFTNENVQKQIATIPNREILLQAVADGDLERMLPLLRSRAAYLPRVLQDLTEIQTAFPEYQRKAQQTFWERIPLIGTIFAQEDIKNVDAKEQLRNSAFLMMRMRDIASDPDAALPSLEERLNYLQDRKNLISGVVGIAADDFGDDVQKVENGVRTPSTKNLLEAKGILTFISATANFQKLEQAFAHAANGMRTGLGRIQSLFAFDIPPSAEAASILEESGAEQTVAALSGEDIVLQRTAIVELIQHQRVELDSLLEKLDEGEAMQFEKNIAAIQDKVDEAESTTVLRLSLEELNTVINDMEDAARKKKNIFQRIGYRIQDFFGITA